MEIKTSRFGILDIDEKKVINISKGILGFPDAVNFFLLPHSKNSPFHWMQCVDDEKLAFVVIHPAVFCADYSFDIPDSAIDELEIEDPEQLDVLVLVTVRQPSASSKKASVSANLLGPVIINTVNMKGMQLVLDPGKYPVQFEIPLK